MNFFFVLHHLFSQVLLCWLLCLLCFTSPGSLTGSYTEDKLKLVSSIALKKWNTNFRLEHSVRKNRTTFQMLLCSRKFPPEWPKNASFIHFPTWFSGNCLGGNDCRNSTLSRRVTTSDWLKQISLVARHQYGISALVQFLRRHFAPENSVVTSWNVDCFFRLACEKKRLDTRRFFFSCHF